MAKRNATTLAVREKPTSPAPRSAARTPAVVGRSTSFDDRIRWILEARGIGQRELSRRSGLDGVHVAKILMRARRNPDATVDARTMTAIARGGGVSLRWLNTGIGRPDARDDPPPGSDRDRLAALANELARLSPKLVGHVKGRHTLDTPLGLAREILATFAEDGRVSKTVSLKLVTSVQRTALVEIAETLRDPARVNVERVLALAVHVILFVTQVAESDSRDR